MSEVNPRPEATMWIEVVAWSFYFSGKKRIAANRTANANQVTRCKIDNIFKVVLFDKWWWHLVGISHLSTLRWLTDSRSMVSVERVELNDELEFRVPPIQCNGEKNDTSPEDPICPFGKLVTFRKGFSPKSEMRNFLIDYFFLLAREKTSGDGQS